MHTTLVISISLIVIVFCLGVFLLVPFRPSLRMIELDAIRKVCTPMAQDVLTGTASRFDYMATRCPARYLLPTEDK